MSTKTIKTVTTNIHDEDAVVTTCASEGDVADEESTLISAKSTHCHDATIVSTESEIVTDTLVESVTTDIVTGEDGTLNETVKSESVIIETVDNEIETEVLVTDGYIAQVAQKDGDDNDIVLEEVENVTTSSTGKTKSVRFDSGVIHVHTTSGDGGIEGIQDWENKTISGSENQIVGRAEPRQLDSDEDDDDEDDTAGISAGDMKKLLMLKMLHVQQLREVQSAKFALTDLEKKRRQLDVLRQSVADALQSGDMSAMESLREQVYTLSAPSSASIMNESDTFQKLVNVFDDITKSQQPQPRSNRHGSGSLESVATLTEDQDS
ncbi:hypothetical protein HDU76_011544, partial [Blyttiomyces sp. JEL0837]